tara:strand:+ start:3033 stop:4283 length:1251 start_codon:yes stop_codon:yes gene_type:complete
MINGLRPLCQELYPDLSLLLNYSSKRRLNKAVNIDDFRKAAKMRAHPMVFGYLDGGADGEVALRKSVEAYKDYDLYHSVLHGVCKDDIDLSTKILNIDSKLPFFITSCAGQKMFHSQGEIATAKAANKNGIPMALSQLTTSTFEEVNKEAPNHCKALQLYVWRDKDLLSEVLENSRKNGFTSLVLTADFSWVGNREKETKTGFTIPPNYSLQQCMGAIKHPAWTFDYMSHEPYKYQAIPHCDFPAETLVDFIKQQMKPEFDWEDAKWLIKEWKKLGGDNVALKGVANSNEARKAVEIGFDTIWVSNHGGRQLESSIPTINNISDIRNTLGKDVEIILDGGVRRGIDVLKAICLGADSVAIGRAYLYGLTAGGFEGVDKVIQILHRDVELSLGLLGCKNIQEVKDKSSELIVKNRFY